ncbi:retrovirus-related pol polyprotein from transposon TNT 1-94 [Tanacetum coccineum]|uniref:Retrovirus-related pol polyprotein from transposon TNT 1-94 n=1 Tax=Tanacetum coccineum TaxID=301880 RepID=A0ABQ4ZJ31_9ASTR
MLLESRNTKLSNKVASKSKRRKFYTYVLRSNAGWKTKDLKGMAFDQLEEKFIPVWESIQDFVPMDFHKESDGNLQGITKEGKVRYSELDRKNQSSKTKADMHRQLSHLNFDTLNKLAKDGLARGIPKLKFQKDHLCSVKFSRSKDEAPNAIIKCIKNIQVRLNATVRNVRSDNGTKFVNQTLYDFYENDGISHQTSIARTPQLNGVVERRNRTLMEAAHTMLIFSKAPLDDWDTLFQSLFDEYFNPPTIVVSTVLVVAAPRAVEIADSPVSTSIDQDAPSSSIPSTQDQEHSPIISHGVEES